MKPSAGIPLAAALLITLFLTDGRANEIGQPGGGPPLEQLYPGPLGMADFGKIVSGEFTGDLKRDAVVMDGVKPKLLVAPETFDSAITVLPTANDIAVLSGALATPGKDCLLTVSAAGLQRHERLSASSSWSVVTLRDASTAWNNALFVAVAQVDGVGPLDIVGVASDARTVMVLNGNADGTYTAGAAFLSAAPGVTGLWLLNWRETSLAGACEIALNSPLGIGVYTRNGTLIGGLEWSGSPLLGAVVTYAGNPEQRLATVAPSEGLTYLRVIGDDGPEPYVVLGTMGCVSAASGDADHDGDDELFLGVNTERKFWMLENLGAASPSFSMSALTKFAYGPGNRDPSLNHAGLAPGDFDSDGDLDVLAPAQGDPGPVMAVYGSVDLINVESEVVSGWKPSILSVTYVTSINSIEFRFTRPTTLLPAPAGTHRKIGVKIYWTAELGAGTAGSPYFSAFIGVPPQFQTTPLLVPMPAGFSLQHSTDLFSFVARQTLRDTATGTTLDIAPAMTAIFTPDPNTNVITQVPKTLLVVPAMTDPSASPSYGGMSVGPTVPSMDAEVQPQDEDP